MKVNDEKENVLKCNECGKEQHDATGNLAVLLREAVADGWFISMHNEETIDLCEECINDYGLAELFSQHVGENVE